ncbi:MAG: class I SAM-dependent methyltransferase [Bacteroidota bacterium]
MSLITITQCPICKGSNFEAFHRCIDFTASKEEFAIVKCTSCNLLITSPRPDSNAIGKYYESEDYISHSNSSKSLTDNVYKTVRSFTLRWKLNLVESEKPKGCILDYGCGTGEFLSTCIKYNWDAYGVEPSDQARRKAIQLTSLPITKSLNQLTNKKFDIITLWHVLEHIDNLNEKISELKSRLTENGTIFIAVPNCKSLDARIYKTQWAAYDVPRHLWHFSKENIKNLLASHGLQLTNIIPMKQDSYYISFLSEKYRHPTAPIFIDLIKAFLIGTRSNLAGRKDQNYSSLVYIAKA